MNKIPEGFQEGLGGSPSTVSLEGFQEGLPSLAPQQQKAPTTSNAVITTSNDARKTPASIDEFVQQIAPVAQRIAQKIGAPVEAVIGQLGLETGWGKSVIPGTNNYGNIKDTSGGGVAATDNMNGSRDRYRQYASADDFADDYAKLVGTNPRYKGAVGAKDAQSFFTGLKQGGYAEDPNYVQSGVAATQSVSKVLRNQASTQSSKSALPDLSSVPKWGEIAASEKYAKLPDAEKLALKNSYFDDWIAPHAAANGDNVDAVRAEFIGAPAKQGPGLLDRAADAAKGVLRNMNPFASTPSVMEGVSQTERQANTDRFNLPISKETRAKLDYQYNTATPEQRIALAQADGVAGMYFGELNKQYGLKDKSATANDNVIIPSGNSDIGDPRVDARARQLVKDGASLESAQARATTAAQIGLTPGDEQYGTANKSNFDFETQAKYEKLNPVIRGAVKGYEGFKQGSLGVFRAAADLVGADDASKRFAAGAAESTRTTDAIGENKNYAANMFEGAVSSIAQQLPMLVGGALTGSEPIVLASMAVQSFGQEYSNGRDKGLAADKAAERAGLFAAFEVIGEKFGLGESLKGIQKTFAGAESKEIIAHMAKALAAEVPGEALTTTGQFVTDKVNSFGLNKEAGWKDYLEQMRDTVVQTVMQGGLMMGGTGGVRAAADHLSATGERGAITELNANAARDRALSKWENNPLVQPAQADQPDGRVEPTGAIDPAAAIQQAEPAYQSPQATQSPQAHPTEQIADSIVRDLAEKAGLPLEMLLPAAEVTQPAQQPTLQNAPQQAAVPQDGLADQQQTDQSPETREIALWIKAGDGTITEAERAELSALQQQSGPAQITTPPQEQANGTQAAQAQQTETQGNEQQQVPADSVAGTDNQDAPAPGAVVQSTAGQQQTQATQAVPNTAKQRALPDDLLGLLNASGGISSSLKSDIDQDAKGRPGLYRAAGRNVDEIGALMAEHGYIQPAEAHNSEVVLDMLRRAVGGERIMTAQGMENAQAREEELKHRATLAERASAIGINPANKSIAQLETEIDAHAQSIEAMSSMSDAQLSEAIKAAADAQKKSKTLKNRRTWQNLSDEKARRDQAALIERRQQEIAQRKAISEARHQARIKESAEAEQTIEEILNLFGSDSPSFRWLADKFTEMSQRETADQRKSGYDSLVRATRQASRKWNADQSRVESVIEKSLEDGYGSKNLHGAESHFGQGESVPGQTEPGNAGRGIGSGGLRHSDESNGSFTLEAPTRSTLAEKIAREGDQALADKQTADAQREGFTLDAQSAPESRSDSTADMFGGPSVADFQKSKERDRQQAGQTSEGDLFSQSNDRQMTEASGGKGSGGSAAETKAADQEKLAQDYRNFRETVMGEIMRRGDLPKLMKGTGKRAISGFNALSLDDQASAYAEYVAKGAEPVAVPEDYNAWVRQQYDEAEQRRKDADTPGAVLAERQRIAEGRPTYTEAQTQALRELGITGETADGDIEATEAQWVEIDKRTDAILRGEVPFDRAAQGNPATRDETTAKQPETARAEQENSAAQRFPDVADIRDVHSGPGGLIEPRRIAEGKTLYREVGAGGLHSLLGLDSQAEATNFFVADNPDLALGQAENKGVQIEFRPNSLSGAEHKKPGTGDSTGREYRVDIRAPRAVQSVTMKASFLPMQRGIVRRVLASEFSRTELPDGRIRFDRKGMDSSGPLFSRSEPRTPPTTDVEGMRSTDISKSGQEWSGRGRKPQWVADHLAAGGTLEQIAVAQENQPARAETPQIQPESARVAQESSAETKAPAAKIKDAGEQLYWNRSNPWRGGGLKFADLAGENATMRAKLTTKAKVWARPDWAAWVKGLEQYDDTTREAMTIAGRLAKMTYDAIPTAPSKKDDETLQRYIDTVTQIREATESFLNDPAGVKQMLVETFAGNQDSLRRFSAGVKQAKHPIFAAVFPAQADGAKWEKGTEAYLRAVLMDKAVGAMQWSHRDYAKAKKDIDDNGWPVKREAWQRQGLRVVARDDVRVAVGDTTRGTFIAGLRYPGGRWERVTEESVSSRSDAQQQAEDALKALPAFQLFGKSGRKLGAFETEAEAVDAARATVAKQGGRDEKEVSEVWTLDTAKRIGADRRKPGQNVSSDDLKETFGFRGVNFGKWVSQDERQKHLNHAYDSMHDLAEVMGVPPKAMSLDGMLGLAFGAQGNGGGAAAHFVPGVNEINLTRTQGVGSLAHEWGHALDHYFGVQAGLDRDNDPFVSELASRHERAWPKDSTIRPEIREAFVTLNKSLRERIESPEETAARKLEGVERARKQLDAQIEGLGLAAKIPAEVLAELRAGNAGESVKLDPASRKKYPETVGAIVKNVGEEAGLSKDQITTLDALVGMVRYTKSSLQADAGVARTIHTKFYSALKGIQNESKKKQNGKDYWTQPTEMFARAFEGYVTDKLKRSEAVNDYLVRPNDDATDIPQGDERLEIEQAFDTLVAGIQSKETDSGTALFSRSESRTPPTTDVEGMRSTDISKANKLAMVFSAIGKFEDAFQRETPQSKSMEDITREVMPTATIRKLNEDLPAEWDMSGIPDTWEISTKDSKVRVGRFMSDGKHVWIDVSRLLAGKDLGSAMYAIAAAYAHNNGQVFIGDPAGLSPIAFFRRLENMISSAIKYGTTDHLMPHSAQMNPEEFYAKEYPDFAKAVEGLGLQWKTGDFDSNLKQMLLTSYNAAKRFMPGIEDIEYDYTSGGFRRVSDHARVDRNYLENLPRERVGDGPEASKRYYAGGATTARAVLVQSVSRAEGSEAWRGILAALDNQLRGRRLDPALVEIFYSKENKTQEQIARELFGNPNPKSTVEQITKELAGEGSLGPNIKIVQSALDLPPEERRQVYKSSAGDVGLQAVFFTDSGKTYVIADNIEPGEALAALMHDGGVHAGMYGMIGERGINSLAYQIKDWARNSPGTEEGRISALALSRIPEGTSPAHRNEEAVAYFVTEAVKAGHGDPKPTETNAVARWFARLWKMVEAAIQKLGADPASLKVDDIVALARGALEKVKAGEIDPRRGPDKQAEPLESRSSQYSPEQYSFRKKAGIGARPTIRQKIARWAEGMKDSLSWTAFRQGALDQFHGIKLAELATIGALPVEQSAYVTARLATGASSVMAGLLGHGQARWAANGQHLEKIEGTKGLLDILKPVEGQLDDFLGWMVATRASRLMKEGRENNFTQADIQAGLSLANGKEDLFKQVAKDFADFKRSVLDIAQQAGLIDPVGRKVWDHADWIPFYRQMQDDTTKAPGGKRGLSQQSSGIRQLKGGESAMNDPLENILLNFNHLIDASLKNNALRKVIGNVEGRSNSDEFLQSVGYGMQGAIIPRDQIKKQLIAAGTPQQMIDALPAEALYGMAKMWALHAPQGKDIIRVMENGKPHFYRVTDPLLLKAVTSFEPFNVPGLATMRAFKRLLTRSVTATPAFMARNFIRDSASSAILNRDRLNMLGAFRGIVKSFKEEGGFEQMLFAGASFSGGQSDGADPESTASAMRRELRKKGFSAASADEFMASILDKPMKIRDAYSRISDSIENANREAMFEAAKKSGKSDTAAAFEALDLMDFRLRGSSAAYQLFADIIPFVNARVQGLYRLGRSDMKQVAVRGGLMLLIPSVLLALANAGNDDYEELPDWDKDTYWHLFIGGKHYRMPKPFEVGVMFGTIPERITRAALGNDSPKKLASRVWFNIADQFNLVQWPQFIKPAIEVAMNEDGFSKRAIETVSDKGKIPSMRASYYTSDTMKALAGLIPSVSDATGMSPKRMEHLWNGYLGSVGAAALGVSDLMVRRYQGVPYQESMRLDEYPLLGVFYRENPAKNSQYVEDLYKMAADSAELKKSFDAARKEGNTERARQLLEDNKDRIKASEMLGHASASMSSSSKQIEAIRKNGDLTPDQKREKIDAVLKRRNEIAEKVAKQAMKAWGGSI